MSIGERMDLMRIGIDWGGEGGWVDDLFWPMYFIR